jgi:hypothetical protein
MILFLTLVFTALCVWIIFDSIRGARADRLVSGVLGFFSIGYFILPLVFRERSPLETVDDRIVEKAVVMALLFLFSVQVGIRIVDTPLCSSKNASQTIELSFWDKLLFVRPKMTFFFCLIVFLIYLSKMTLTVYQAGGVGNFISSYSSWNAIIAFLGNMANAIMAVILARELGNSQRVWKIAGLALYFVPLVILIATAQRNAVLLPFVYLAVAFSIFGHTKIAYRALLGGALLIVVASPFLVFFREMSTMDFGVTFLESAQLFSDDFNSFDIFIQSLVDRADVLFNMSIVIDNINRMGFAGGEYFASVPLKFIPGILFSDKPIALSNNGSIDGHLSVMIWQFLKDDDSLGSLTIFGAITAYREGGWVWMIVNGILTGSTMTYLFQILNKSSDWKKVLYVIIFPGLCVKSVPPSFFELITSLSGLLYVYIILLLLDIVFVANTRKRKVKMSVHGFSSN